MAKWIDKAIKHPGALHRELGVPQGQPIPAKKLAAAARKPGVEGRRARLAETLKGLNHSHGSADGKDSAMKHEGKKAEHGHKEHKGGHKPAHGAVTHKGGGVVTGKREPKTAHGKHPEHGPHHRKPMGKEGHKVVHVHHHVHHHGKKA